MMSAVHIILLVTLDLLDLSNSLQEKRFSLPPSGCICPDSELTFNCTIIGRGATIWRASFINDCHGNEDVTLIHDNWFNQTQTCNGGAITAKAMGADTANLIYTSRLIINLMMISLSNGSSINCSHYNDTDPRVANKWTVIDSPMNLHLEEANTTHLKFSWDTFFGICPPFRYDIHTTNCGSCLESVDSATVVCNNLQISTDAQLCSIAVQSRCNEVVGNTSDILQVVLKVPEAPLLLITKHRNKESDHDILLNLGVTIKEVVPVSVPTLPGPDSYTIIYTDINSDMNCNTTVIPASHCEHGICKHMLEVSNYSSCSANANIMVTTFATNMFGESPQTIAFADGVNKLLDIGDDRKVVCEYSKDPTMPNGPTTLCISNSTHGINNCENQLGKTDSDNNLSDSNVMTTKDVSRCYFVVFKHDGTVIVLIEGMLNTLDSDDSSKMALIVTFALLTIISVGLLVLNFISLRRLCYCRKRFRSLKSMDVFVKDKPGSLVKVLEVFQREKISVSCVDTIHPPLRQYSDQRPRGFHIVYECSGVNVGSLCKKLKSESVDAEPALPRQESNDFERLGSPITLQFSVENKSGAFLRVLLVLDKYGIDIDCLDTVNKNNPPLDIREFIVEGLFFKFTRESLRAKLKAECKAKEATFVAKARILQLQPGIELKLIKHQIKNLKGSFHIFLRDLSAILKSNGKKTGSNNSKEIICYDREIPFIDLAPGDTKKQHQVCLVCAYPTSESGCIEQAIMKKFKKICIQSLSNEAKKSIGGEIEISVCVGPWLDRVE